MAAIHSITFIGNVTRDPELRYLPNGTAVLSVPVAVNDTYGSGESQREVTTYYDCSFFGEQAERVNSRGYLKGDLVVVQGQPELGTYVARDGTPKVSARVHYGRIFRIGGRRGPEGDFRAAPEEGAEQAPTPPAASTPRAGEQTHQAAPARTRPQGTPAGPRPLRVPKAPAPPAEDEEVPF